MKFRFCRRYYIQRLILLWLLLTLTHTQLFSKYEIELKITGDFPKGEYIYPEVVTLNGKNINEHEFPPGDYKLCITEPGYFPLRKKVTISANQETFVIQETLITKPRKVQLDITYDMPPPQKLAPFQITIAPLDDPTRERVVTTGDMVKPNSYILKIVKTAYQTIEVKQHVWPDERPFTIDQKLYAKQVMISCKITHDVPPPENLRSYQVSIISKKTRVLFLSEDPFIRPGLYEVKITQPGYHTIAYDLDIRPGGKPIINECLIAKERGLSFEINTLTEVDLVEIINLKTQKVLDYRSTFHPTQKLHLQIKFKFHETITKTVKIVPGEGRQLVYISPKPLLSAVTIRGNAKKHYEFAIDSRPVETHHIHKSRSKFSCSYSIWIPKNAKKLTVFDNYLFSDFSVSEKTITLGEFKEITLGKFNKISIPKLIAHMKKTSNQSQFLSVLEEVTTKHKSLLQNCSRDYKDLLISYLENQLHVHDKQVQMFIDKIRQGK